MDDALAVGIDVGGTKLVGALLDPGGRILRRVRRDTPARDAVRLVDELESLVRELGPRLPVGIGIAGLVTPAGVVRYGTNIAVSDLDLAGELGARIGRSVVVVNDASAATFGEQRIGAGQGHRDVLMLTLGTGVGGGLVVDGRLVAGANGFAGELGHLVIAEGGRPCPCGNLGCLEAYASGSAIGRRAGQRLVEAETTPSRLRQAGQRTGKDVSQAAQAGDALAREILVEAGGWLGVGLAGLVNALDPQVVLLGGGAAAENATWMLPEADRAMRARLNGRDLRDPPPLRLAALHDDAGMVGAGLLAAEKDEGAM